MQFKVTTLVENHVAQSGKKLIGEHGLSFYIETDNRRILFDTGQNLAIANNADVLGIDLGRIDTVVLSHGHYDHSGGLQSLLERNTDFMLFAHPDVFGEKVKKTDEKYKYIGIPVDRRIFKQKGIHLNLDKNPAQIAPGVMTTGEIPLDNDFEVVEPVFLLKEENAIVADTLADDRALIMDTANGLVVLLGCSHRGVINTLNHVVDLTGEKTVHAILGGLHLGKATQETLGKISDHLHAFQLETIGIGHCSGPQAFVALSNEFKDRVFLNTVGKIMEF